MKNPPVINLKACTGCGSCVEVAAEIFARNPESGEVEVLELSHYPDELVQTAINICPADCIAADAD